MTHSKGVILTPAFRFRLGTDGSAWSDTNLLRQVRRTKQFVFYEGFEDHGEIDCRVLVVVYADGRAFELADRQRTTSVDDVLKALYYGEFTVWHPPVCPTPWRGLGNIQVKFNPARLP